MPSFQWDMTPCLQIVIDVSVEFTASAIMVLVADPEDAVSQLSGSFLPVGTVSCWHHCENLNCSALFTV